MKENLHFNDEMQALDSLKRTLNEKDKNKKLLKKNLLQSCFRDQFCSSDEIPILADSYYLVVYLAQRYDLLLRVPETLVSGRSFEISYIYNTSTANDRGLDRERKVHVTSVKDQDEHLLDIFEQWNMLNQIKSICKQFTLSLSIDLEIQGLIPTCVTKYKRTNYNTTFLDFFVPSCLDRYHDILSKRHFIMQRFIPQKGNSPFTLRVVLKQPVPGHFQFKFMALTSHIRVDGKTEQFKYKTIHSYFELFLEFQNFYINLSFFQQYPKLYFAHNGNEKCTAALINK